MSDLISRQDVIDAVIKYCTKYDLRELLADIEVLPSVEQAQAKLDDVSNAYENGYQQGKFEAQQWIPVSERLPEEEGMYPVVINGTDPVLSVKYEQGFAMGYFAPVDEAWEIDGHEDSINDLEVLAWMELPPCAEEEQ